MPDPPPFERQGLFQFMELPPEIRCRVYYFAVVQPLIADYENLATAITKRPSSVSLYATENDLRMLGTSHEFRKEMNDLLYSENSFYFSTLPTKPERGERVFRIDTTRIEKCHLYIEDMSGQSRVDWEDSDLDDYDRDSLLIRECYNIEPIVSTLVFKGYRLKYLLVECGPQECLREGLAPMAMLRKIQKVHFRSCQAENYPYFRYLEDLMMNDQPVPFQDWQEFEVEAMAFDGPEADRGYFMTEYHIVKSEAQMEATARDLYSILGIEGEFIVQSKLK